MYDSREELESAAGEGDLQAQADLLQFKVTRGELSQKALLCLCYLGDPAAQLAISDGGVGGNIFLLEEWAQGLGSWGKEACVRAAIAASRYCLPLFERERIREDRPQKAVEEAEMWVVCPCVEHAELARSAAGEAAWAAAGGISLSARSAAHAASGAARAAAMAGDEVLRAAALATVDAGKAVYKTGRSRDESDGQIRDAVRQELAPWVLGTQDVIALRVGRLEP